MDHTGGAQLSAHSCALRLSARTACRFSTSRYVPPQAWLTLLPVPPGPRQYCSLCQYFQHLSLLSCPLFTLPSRQQNAYSRSCRRAYRLERSGSSWARCGRRRRRMSLGSCLSSRGGGCGRLFGAAARARVRVGKEVTAMEERTRRGRNARYYVS